MARAEYGDFNDPRFRLLHGFLRLSPIYRQMLLYMGMKNGQDHPPRNNEGLDQVYNTCRFFGDVINTPYENWIIKIKEKLENPDPSLSIPSLGKFSKFMTAEEVSARINKSVMQMMEPGKQEKDFMILSLPLEGDQKSLIKSLQRLVETNVKNNSNEPSSLEFKFQSNKIQLFTLEIALRVIHTKIVNPDAPLFIIGNKAGVSPENITESDEPRTDKNRKQRQRMEIFTSRYLQRGLIFAQNAAIGKFPSLDDLPKQISHFSFRWQELNELYGQELNKEYSI